MRMQRDDAVDDILSTAIAARERMTNLRHDGITPPHILCLLAAQKGIIKHFKEQEAKASPEFLTKLARAQQLCRENGYERNMYDLTFDRKVTAPEVYKLQISGFTKEVALPESNFVSVIPLCYHFLGL